LDQEVMELISTTWGPQLEVAMLNRVTIDQVHFNDNIFWPTIKVVHLHDYNEDLVAAIIAKCAQLEELDTWQLQGTQLARLPGTFRRLKTELIGLTESDVERLQSLEKMPLCASFRHLRLNVKLDMKE